MTGPADLTLLALRLIQGPPKPPVREWFFLPGFVETSAEDARAVLESTPKPVVVSPVLDPGCVALWTLASLEPAARARAEHLLANQQAFFEAKLSALFPDGVDAVQLAEGDANVTLDLEAFRTWAREYFITSGSGLEPGPEPRVARLMLRRPRGG